MCSLHCSCHKNGLTNYVIFVIILTVEYYIEYCEAFVRIWALAQCGVNSATGLLCLFLLSYAIRKGKREA